MASIVDHNTFLSHLEQRLHSELRRLGAGVPRDGLVSITLAAAPLAPRRLPDPPAPYAYWALPQRGLYRLGLGEAYRFETAGAQRFEALARRYARLTAGWIALDPDGLGLAPSLFTVFAYDGGPMQGPWAGLPNSLLLVPSVLAREERGQAALTCSCPARECREPRRPVRRWLQQIEALLADEAVEAGPNALYPLESSPSDEDWMRLVEAGRATIRDGGLAKVVPARRVRMQCERALRPSAVIAALAELYPACRLLALDLGPASVVAATPERLLILADGRAHCDALGGTIARGADPAQDAELGRRLLRCSKSRREHAHVVEHIREALEPVCDELEIPAAPQVVQLRTVQHLWTPITGRPRGNPNPYTLAARLHPTPAVSGMPSAAAQDWLRRHEGLERGWYTGAVGWLGPDGSGELAVLLRCALLKGRHADLFAGAGVVADSDPAAELHETELKLQAVLEAMHRAGPQPMPPLTALRGEGG